VVAPETRPLERVLGPELGDFVRRVHEEHGVVFHLGETLASIDAKQVTTSGGAKLDADLIVAGIGVRPVLGPAELAGAEIDRGVVVDELLETRVPGVFAAGDIARYPDPNAKGRRIRVEHWALAQRQGQTAAKNILGKRVPFRVVPFFWSNHYDVTINYVGHVEKWDRIDVRGDLTKKDALVAYREAGEIRAIATVFRDDASLAAEAALERGDQRALEALVG
jgi:NADPH-dependent 2,4-dienoyl-CoA reductase/sulfur reductase-like enzyme